MIQSITFSQFTDEFNAIRPDNFSYQGLRALYDYLIDYEDGTGSQVELDVIALCCDFSEYSDLEEFQNDYGDDYETIEDIEKETIVIRFGVDSFIIQEF